MRRASGLLLTLCLAGCGLITTTPGQPDAPPSEQAAAQDGDDTSNNREQVPELSELLLSRQQLCLLPNDARAHLLEKYRAVFIEKSTDSQTLPAIQSATEHKLNALMLASCNPARTPGVLREMLALITEGHWPAEYVALFDLLIASHHAYVLLDDKQRNVVEQNRKLQENHRVLQQEYQALQTEHENTIRGISDIERGIDLPQSEDLGL